MRLVGAGAGWGDEAGVWLRCAGEPHPCGLALPGGEVRMMWTTEGREVAVAMVPAPTRVEVMHVRGLGTAAHTGHEEGAAVAVTVEDAGTPGHPVRGKLGRTT